MTRRRRTSTFHVDMHRALPPDAQLNGSHRNPTELLFCVQGPPSDIYLCPSEMLISWLCGYAQHAGARVIYDVRHSITLES